MTSGEKMKQTFTNMVVCTLSRKQYRGKKEKNKTCHGTIQPVLLYWLDVTRWAAASPASVSPSASFLFFFHSSLIVISTFILGILFMSFVLGLHRSSFWICFFLCKIWVFHTMYCLWFFFCHGYIFILWICIIGLIAIVPSSWHFLEGIVFWRSFLFGKIQLTHHPEIIVSQIGVFKVLADAESLHWYTDNFSSKATKYCYPYHKYSMYLCMYVISISLSVIFVLWSCLK